MTVWTFPKCPLNKWKIPLATVNPISHFQSRCDAGRVRLLFLWGLWLYCVPRGCDMSTSSWLGHVFACFCSNIQLVLSSGVGPLLSFSEFLESWQFNIANLAASLTQWAPAVFYNVGPDNDSLHRESIFRREILKCFRKSHSWDISVWCGHYSHREFEELILACF